MPSLKSSRCLKSWVSVFDCGDGLSSTLLIDSVDVYARLTSDNLPIKEQVKVDQVYLHAAYFFGRVVIKIYLADLMRLMLSGAAENRD